MRNKILTVIVLASLVLVVVPLVGCVSRFTYESLQAEYANLLQENKSLEGELNEIQSELTRLKDDYDELKTGYDELKTDYDELMANYDELTLNDEIAGEELFEINEASQSTEVNTLQYTWEYDGREWSWDILIPQALYDYYQQLPRLHTSNYSVYVTHPMDDIYIDALVEKITSASQQAGYSGLQTIEFAIAFVQSLPYTADSVTTPYDEYPRYPVETLLDNGGDCEDTSILMASLLHSMDYGVVLLSMPDHAAVGVLGGEGIYGTYWEYDEGKYYYLETTSEGWGIGEIPDEYKNVGATINPMVPVPILTHEGSIESSGYIAEVEVVVYNQGTASANNVTVSGGFDAGEGMAWNLQESKPFTIGVNQQATITLNLLIPLDKHTRLIIMIGIDGILVEESYTDWFDT